MLMPLSAEARTFTVGAGVGTSVGLESAPAARATLGTGVGACDGIGVVGESVGSGDGTGVDGADVGTCDGIGDGTGVDGAGCAPAMASATVQWEALWALAMALASTVQM